MRSTVKREMRTKSGVVIKAGEVVDVVKHPEYDSLVRSTTEDGRHISISAMNVGTKLTGFKKMPSDRTLEKWVTDSVCRSITGQKVEPDGYDSKGFPSWLLVMGLM